MWGKCIWFLNPTVVYLTNLLCNACEINLPKIGRTWKLLYWCLFLPLICEVNVFIVFSKSPEASMGHSGGEHLLHSQNTLMYFWCQRTVWKSHPNSCSLRNERISEDTWCTVHQARAKNQSLSSPPLPAGGHGVGFGWRFWKLPSLTPRSPLHSFFGILASDDLIASRRWG